MDFFGWERRYRLVYLLYIDVAWLYQVCFVIATEWMTLCLCDTDVQSMVNKVMFIFYKTEVMETE